MKFLRVLTIALVSAFLILGQAEAKTKGRHSSGEHYRPKRKDSKPRHKDCCKEVVGECKDKTCKTKFDYCADFVIIGMGGAGCVLARNLTDAKFSVFGMEAGANDCNDPAIQDPISSGLTRTMFPQYFWCGVSIPQTQLDDRTFEWTSGRLCGGGVSVNGHLYVRGTNNGWQSLADLCGDDWSTANIFRRYKEIECFTNQNTGPISPNRGTNGLLDLVAGPLDITPDAQFLMDGYIEATGLQPVNDYNDQDENPNGPFFRWNDWQNKVSGLRESTFTGFLGPDVMSFDGKGLNGRKLEVSFNTTCLEIIFDECDPTKAIGVRFTRGGKCFTVRAKKEVILSAGFRSAQYLQLNGIGPVDTLVSAGVPVRVASKHNGRHLTNHPIVTLRFNAPNLDTGGAQPGFPTLVRVPGAFLPAVLPTNDPTGTRDIQWIMNDNPQANPDDSSFNLTALLLFPKSEGTIDIQDNDGFKMALVDVNYLGDTDGPGGTSLDLQTLRVGIQNLGLRFDDYFQANQVNHPGWGLSDETRTILESDADTDDFIRAVVRQAHHWGTSCRIGINAESDDGGVVDCRGRVFGTKCLRVADNSILRDQIDANLGGPSALVGWSIAEFLVEDHS